MTNQKRKVRRKKYRLSDYKLIRSPFCFLDETGKLHSPRDRFFALGMIKCNQPMYIYKEMNWLRDKEHFYDEIKFSKLSKKKYPILIKFLDCLFIPGVRFYCIIIDKETVDWRVKFNNDPFNAYENFAYLLLKGSRARNEILTVIADNYPSPRNDKFEIDIKRGINFQFKELAINGICRMDSKGSDLLQMADLILGTIVYEFKIKARLPEAKSRLKRKFLREFKERFGVNTFINGYRKKPLNIHIYQ